MTTAAAGDGELVVGGGAIADELAIARSDSASADFFRPSSSPR